MRPIFKFTAAVMAAGLISSGPAVAQASGKPNETYTQQCVQQQRAIHQGLKDKVSDADFLPYCSCFIGALEKRLTPEQFRGIANTPKGGKPAWLKQAESDAGRSCIPSEPRLQV